ncbi:2OG-Fe dioxygenase family protein [Pantoea agglomerans]|uniref:2OG-Fe dioxygenase family protein n=1 Tax=Enterobacter agglomerans TaxID=549 RepID=UPI003C7DE685
MSNATLDNVSSENIKNLKTERFVFGSACDVLGIDFLNHSDWQKFQNFFTNLELDNYMMDGGLYRKRRFGRFKWFSDGDRLEQQPQTAYTQPLYFNPLNGGIERHFAPLTDNIVNSPILKLLLRKLANAYGELEEINTWKINTYFNRIISTQDFAGQPVPEGKHRDGVKFSCLFMANRSNVSGGSTTLTDILYQKHVFTGTLENPGEVLIFRDDTVIHDTSAIEVNRDAKEGYRDVLVIEFY